MDNNFSNIATDAIKGILALTGAGVFVVFVLSIFAEKILEKILGDKILDAIMKRIQWSVILIVIVVSAILYFFIPRPDFEPLLIVLVSVFSMLCAVLLLLRLFLTPFGFKNIKDLTSFAQGLDILESDNVQKALSELKAIPEVAKGIQMARSDIKIIDYKTLEKEISQAWMLGTSFHTERKWEECIEKLKKDIACTYVCCGGKETMETNARSFVSWAEANSNLSILENKLNKIDMHYTNENIYLPKIFHDPMNIHSKEVFICFPSDIENSLSKKNLVVSVKDTSLIEEQINQFSLLRQEEKKIDLAKLIEQHRNGG